ncbi:nitrate reductase molybdenum cofactor assembly chaperone [Rhizomicrobium electricum]|uniref:Nitrate reductase molybdenum cofactor assembly chaperone n=1 Tax=Rhizomicrobium electricum TaxID=480070 RepID=A0ABN1ES04_9PROT|nr:nitrate reductase molybdenum cofactor assembly chaperone [Rhizomicrobium electricum]NIJ49041.1 nitrate reductase delta subunit [Rhizomicrobium electricum]
MASSYKLLSALLSYPTEDLQAGAAEIAGIALQTMGLSETVRRGLVGLALDLSGRDLIDSQARYVDLFDRSRSLSLHLFEHVYGESRDRGQAMVNLRQRYRDAGLDIASNELPDYLPLLLEFLSQRPEEEARQLLGDAAHVLRALRERLHERGSVYAPVFAALEELGQREPEADQLAAMRKAEIDDPSDLAALDRVWQETEVQFGPGGFGETGCPSARPAARV